MKAHVFCTLPDILASPLRCGTLKRAMDAGALEVLVHDLHELSPDPHHKADDTPYGGGPGMVLRVDVLAHAMESVFDGDATVLKEQFPVILLTPQGKRFDQSQARELASHETLVFLCGRYEGVDERVREHLAGREMSLGDFVLAGGEIAAAAVLEAVARLLPGVLGNDESLLQESFSGPILEYPQYTRPADWRGHRVPDVLVSGDHGRIRAWREEQARQRTLHRRPDLLD
ncbi:MAG: tRNA (guanosine(37)-N1)-methyltransferase TrmD [Actinomycetota bacterium]